MNETSVELARLRLVTPRYDELQGLRKCCAGPGVLAGAWTATWVAPHGFGFLIPSGMLDHQLLARTLRSRPLEEPRHADSV